MNLKIWHKMIIGISIPSFIALTGSLLTYEYLNDVENRHGFVQIADDLKEHVLEVRRNEKNFFLHKNTEYYKFSTDSVSVLANSVNSISAEITEDIGKEEFRLLNESIRTYSKIINALYEHYQHELRNVEEVRAEGRKVEASVAAGKHPQKLSTTFILDLRRLEKNYMLFRDT